MIVTAPISSSDLLRFESLGDNCEFGFVLRRHGCEAGSLFRWAAMGAEPLLGMLRADFQGMYAFENLTPHRTSMVLDTAYGIGWHTDLKSVVAGGRLTFRDDEDTRRTVHRKEVRKLRYLLSKFSARAKLGGVIFVIKANAGIAPETLDGILDALTALAGHTDFALLEVRESDDPARIGTVDRLGPQRLRGYVSRFAAYHKADDSDAGAWTAILANALRLFPCPDWSRRVAGLQVGVVGATVHLTFPFSPSQDLNQPVMGDLRAGVVTLLDGDRWCRPVDDSFRLHGPGPDRPATTLRWTGVHPPGPFQLCGTVTCPIPDSAPVRLSVQIRAEDGTVIAEQRLLVQPGRAEEMAVSCPIGAQPLTIAVSVGAARPLGPGERAVVDLAPPTLHPEIAASALSAAAA